MSQIYYDSEAPGADANQNIADVNNMWADSSRTIPNGALPTFGDDLEGFDQVNAGSASCNNLTSGASMTLFGGSITVGGTATGITVSGGSLVGSGGPIYSIGCTFDSDPGAAINGSSACQYAASMTQSITDDGTGAFGAFSFGGTIVYHGTLSTSGATFSGSVTANVIANTDASTYNGPVACNNVQAGIFNGALTQTGAGVTLVNCTLNAAVTWTGVTFINEVDCTRYNALSAPTISFVLPGGGGTVSYTAAGPDSILRAAGGNWVPPPTSKVLDGYDYGVNGTSLQGTLPSGGATSLVSGGLVS